MDTWPSETHNRVKTATTETLAGHHGVSSFTRDDYRQNQLSFTELATAVAYHVVMRGNSAHDSNFRLSQTFEPGILELQQRHGLYRHPIE
jgi:hypothetical protein